MTRYNLENLDTISLDASNINSLDVMDHMEDGRASRVTLGHGKIFCGTYET